MNRTAELPSVVTAVESYVHRASVETFDALVTDAFAHQYETIEPYRRLCDQRGVTPAGAIAWQQVPWVPVTAFRSLALHAGAPRETFRSSGTTGGEAVRSVHHHPYPDLYRATIDASFPSAVFAGLLRPDVLSLVTPRGLSHESSLGFMIDHVIRRHAGAGSLEALGERGVEAAKARSWLGAHQRAGQPVAVLTTGFALVELLDALERLGVRFRLPPGSVVMETGGLKGRTREISRSDLLERIEGFLAVPRQRVVREYGMTELTSQFYTGALAGEDAEFFRTAPWTRVRALDPESLQPVADGAPGLLAIFDLANLGSALHVLTQDLGVVEGDGFRLLGRLAGAEPRGCSLAVEEMLGRN